VGANGAEVWSTVRAKHQDAWKELEGPKCEPQNPKQPMGFTLFADILSCGDKWSNDHAQSSRRRLSLLPLVCNCLLPHGQWHAYLRARPGRDSGSA
jgi:hypothetical protein